MSLNPKVVPFARGADFARQRALKSMRDNKLVDALELMRQAVEASPENDTYRLEMARLYCDAGCPVQSNRMLLELFSKGASQGECLYTMAVNQLNLNNPESAKRLLDLCMDDKQYEDVKGQAQDLSSEIDMYEALNRPPTRQIERLYRMMDHGCDLMRDEDFAGAQRLFKRVLKMDATQLEARALLAMTQMMQGSRDEALQNASLVEQAEINTVRSLCVAAQVFNNAGEASRAVELLNKARKMETDPLEQRMLAYSMFEAGMLEEARDEANRILQEAPCDRQLLHTLAVIALKKGESREDALRCWKRISRIDPDDTVARYYIEACEENKLNAEELACEYQVPKAEVLDRYRYITEKLDGNLFALEADWKNDEKFRSVITWSLNAYERRFREAAVTLLASIDDPRAETTLREYLLRVDSGYDLTVRAAAMYRMRGLDVARILPPYTDSEAGLLPEGDDVLDGMGVGHRQLVRFSSDILEQRYHIFAYDRLALIWDLYRGNRGTHFDPLIRTEAASAALAFCYLQMVGKQPDPRRVCRQFGCSQRQLDYFVKRLRKVMEKGGALLGKLD